MTQVKGQTPGDAPCGPLAAGWRKRDQAHSLIDQGFMPPAFQGVDPVAPKRRSDYATYIRLHCKERSMSVRLSIALIAGVVIAQGLFATHVKSDLVRVCNPDTKACQFVHR